MMEQTDVERKLKEGLDLFRVRNFIDAKAAFQQVVEARPDSFYGWFHLGRTLFYLRKVEEAKTAFQHGLQENLQLANAWINTGKFCDESAGYKTEETCLAEYLYEHEHDGEIRKLLAEVFYENKSNLIRENCFEERAVSEAGVSGEGHTNQILFERRNCHLTTH